MEQSNTDYGKITSIEKDIEFDNIIDYLVQNSKQITNQEQYQNVLYPKNQDNNSYLNFNKNLKKDHGMIQFEDTNGDPKVKLLKYIKAPKKTAFSKFPESSKESDKINQIDVIETKSKNFLKDEKENLINKNIKICEIKHEETIKKLRSGNFKSFEHSMVKEDQKKSQKNISEMIKGYEDNFYKNIYNKYNDGNFSNYNQIKKIESSFLEFDNGNQNNPNFSMVNNPSEHYQKLNLSKEPKKKGTLLQISQEFICLHKKKESMNLKRSLADAEIEINKTYEDFRWQ